MSAPEEGPGAAWLWERIAPVNEAIMRHPFVTGLTDGSLPGGAFARFVVQDALYLDGYARALALAGARGATTEQVRMFCRHASEAVEVERELHGALLADLGIDAGAVARAEPSPTCLAYTSFLLATAALGDRAEVVGAILPCYWIYWEVGRALAAAGSPDPRYARWIETYGGEEFAAAARGAISAWEREHPALAPEARERAGRAALTAARYEWMFWDSALRDERWPV